MGDDATMLQDPSVFARGTSGRSRLRLLGKYVGTKQKQTAYLTKSTTLTAVVAS